MRFEAAVHALCDAGVEFVVIGGLSATLHGSALVTLDLDVCTPGFLPNLRRLVAALAPSIQDRGGFPDALPFVWDETMLRNTTVLTLLTDLGGVS